MLDHISFIQPRSHTSTAKNIETSTVTSFWERSKTAGLPSKVCDILQASWGGGTKKIYADWWKLWSSWCISRNQCPFWMSIFSYYKWIFIIHNRTIQSMECVIQNHWCIKIMYISNAWPNRRTTIYTKYILGFLNSGHHRPKYVQHSQLKRSYNTWRLSLCEQLLLKSWPSKQVFC